MNGGIYDITDGQCHAHVNISGEDFRCDMNVDHNGWAHSNATAQVIWDGAL